MTPKTALQEAMLEAERMQARGITDTPTIIAACMVVYGARLLEISEPVQIALQKRTFRMYVLLAISMSINLVFSLIAATASIAYLIDRQ